MLTKAKAPIARLHMDEPFASESLALAMTGAFQQTSLVVVCVGTDRSTGDSLGPLIGSRLMADPRSNITVYGTLDEPVHALNLDQYVNQIKKDHPNSTTLAIDACLGRSENVGFISLKEGPLKPGTGVNKTLPNIGDYHLVGIVNVGGLMEYFVLQNTRLSLVMKMSDVIYEGIKLSFQEWKTRPSRVGESAIP